jgi:hypothetical protein
MLCFVRSILVQTRKLDDNNRSSHPDPPDSTAGTVAEQNTINKQKAAGIRNAGGPNKQTSTALTYS